MYAGIVEQIKLPTIGKLKILKNGYVYWFDKSKWDNKLKQTKDNRMGIGKLDPDNPGMFFPNKKYFELFPKDGSPKKKKLLTVEPEFVFNPANNMSDRLNIGPFIALTRAAEQTGCLTALKETFPTLWKRIFAVAMHSIDAQNSTAQDFPDWCYHNFCGLDKNLNSSEISTLYKDIYTNMSDVSDFMTIFREKYLKFMPEAVEHVLAFDSTTQNTYSSHIGLAEYGHPKVDEKLPDINTALFVDETTGIPLYYEHFYGSLLDKTQSPYTMEHIQDLGFNKLFLMMDCGYYNSKLIQALDDMQFGIMCPDHLKLVKDLIRRFTSTITNVEDYYIASENIYGIHIPDYPLYGTTYDAYLYYDPARAEDERGTIHLKVQHLIANALKQKRFSTKLQDKYAPWLKIEKTAKDQKTNRCFKVTPNNAKVQECIDKAGLFVILSNAKHPADKMIQIARTRDHGEKAFRRIKDTFDLNKTYMHNAMTYEGKMFIAYIALIIIESYRWLIKAELKKISSNTTATTLGELRKYQVQLKADGTWMPRYALTKKQKDLFKCLEIKEAHVETYARGIKFRV